MASPVTLLKICHSLSGRRQLCSFLAWSPDHSLSRLPLYGPGFLTLAITGLDHSLLWGAILCTFGYLAASLASRTDDRKMSPDILLSNAHQLPTLVHMVFKSFLIKQWWDSYYEIGDLCIIKEHRFGFLKVKDTGLQNVWGQGQGLVASWPGTHPARPMSLWLFFL